MFGDGEVAGIDYDWDVNLGGYGLLADYFPFGDRFRISGGIFLPSTRATGKANGDLEIGESFFEGVELSGDVEPVDDILPLVSVGYLQPLWESVYLTADVGVIFTNGFTVDLRRSGGPMVPSEELEQEESQFRAKAWDVFPFLAFGLAYRF